MKDMINILDYMFDPSKHNWYGLKMPKETDFI